GRQARAGLRQADRLAPVGPLRRPDLAPEGRRPHAVRGRLRPRLPLPEEQAAQVRSAPGVLTARACAMSRRPRQRRSAAEIASKRRRPRIHPVVHLIILIGALVMVVAFGSEVADRAAGCYTHMSGASTADVQAPAAGAGDAAVTPDARAGEDNAA